MADKNMSFEDFFGLENTEIDEVEEAEEVKEVKPSKKQVKSYTDINKYSNGQLEDNNKKPKKPKKHIVIKIILSTFVLSLVIMGILGKLGEMGIIGKPGIVYNGDTYISGLNIEELAEHEFYVDNKTKRDISGQTHWILNNVEIESGTNKCNIGIENWQFGENILRAINGENEVSFVINLEKSCETNSAYHNFISTLNEYPDQLFSNYAVVNKLTPVEMVENGYYSGEELNNGKYKREQTIDNMKLTVEEIEPYSLFLCKPMMINANQLGIYNMNNI